MVLPFVIALIIFYLFFGGFSTPKADSPTKEEYVPWLKILRYKDKNDASH